MINAKKNLNKPKAKLLWLKKLNEPKIMGSPGRV